MTQRRSIRPAKFAAVLYVAAFGLPALVPISAGLGHSIYHIGQAIREARAFEDAFLAPADGQPADAQSSVDAEAPAHVSRDHAGPGGVGHRHGSTGSSASEGHTHGSQGVEHTHNVLVDGALTLAASAQGSEMGPRAPSSGVDNHIPPCGTDCCRPTAATTAEWTAHAVISDHPFTPLVPPPRA